MLKSKNKFWATDEEVAQTLSNMVNAVEPTSASWREMTPDQKAEIIDLVKEVNSLGFLSAKNLHNRYLKSVQKKGWTYSPTHNAEKKQDPSVRKWADLDMKSRKIAEMWVLILKGFRY